MTVSWLSNVCFEMFTLHITQIDKTRQEKTTLLHLHDTLITDLAPQVAKLIEAGQEQ